MGQLEFREQLISQLTSALDKRDNISEEEEDSEDEDIGQHKYILLSRQSRNCGWCYHMERLLDGRGKERKVTTLCATCEKHVSHTKLKDCMAKAHSKENVNILNVILSKRKVILLYDTCGTLNIAHSIHECALWPTISNVYAPTSLAIYVSMHRQNDNLTVAMVTE